MPAGAREAETAALRAAGQAISDLSSASQLLPGRTDASLARARLEMGRFRAHAAPAKTAGRVAAELRDQASDSAEQAVSALRLLASAEAELGEARSISRQFRLRRSLTPEQLAAVTAVRPLPLTAREMLESYGASVPGLVALTEESLRRVQGDALDRVHQVSGLSVAAEVSALAGLQRAVRTQRSRLSELVDLAKTAEEAQGARHIQLHEVLRDKARTNADLAQQVLMIAQDSRSEARTLAPLVVGLDTWMARPNGQLRYRPDVAQVALSLSSALRAALLDFAAAQQASLIFRGGAPSLAQPWRDAAAALPPGELIQLDGSAGAGSGAAPVTGEVLGVVESMTSLQVNREKAATFLRIRSGENSVTTVVVPFFNPLYVALAVGVVARLRVAESDDVLAEYTNRNTAKRIEALAGEWGTRAGAILARRRLDAEALESWTMWLAQAVRPGFDALPDSLDGQWTWGRWFALSIATGTLA
jgi:hypothetical protein